MFTLSHEIYFWYKKKKKRERKMTIKRGRSRGGLKMCTYVAVNKTFIFFISMLFNFIGYILSVHLNELINLGIDLLEFTKLVPHWNYMLTKKFGDLKPGDNFYYGACVVWFFLA